MAMVPTTAAYPPTPLRDWTTHAPLAVVRAHIAGGHDPKFLAADVTMEGPGLPGLLRGRESITSFLSTFYGAIGDPRLWLETAFESADRAVVVLRVEGTHAGRLLGLPPTGRPIDLSLIALYQVQNGLIRHIRASFDRLALQEQLGVA